MVNIYVYIFVTLSILLKTDIKYNKRKCACMIINKIVAKQWKKSKIETWTNPI